MCQCTYSLCARFDWQARKIMINPLLIIVNNVALTHSIDVQCIGATLQQQCHAMFEAQSRGN